MGIFSKKRGEAYVIVCHLDGIRKYLDHISHYDNMAYFTEDPCEVGHFPTYADAERVADIIKQIRGVSRVKIYDCDDDRWL